MHRATPAFASGILAALLAACGGVQTTASLPQSAPNGAHRTSGSCCNITWNKARLRLPYPTKPAGKAVLTYWAPDGYYFEPLYCKNGGNISWSPHRMGGDKNGYMHVVYWFRARTPGPDECSLAAVLSGTGSPPIAVIELRILR